MAGRPCLRAEKSASASCSGGSGTPKEVERFKCRSVTVVTNAGSEERDFWVRLATADHPQTSKRARAIGMTQPWSTLELQEFSQCMCDSSAQTTRSAGTAIRYDHKGFPNRPVNSANASN